MNRPFNLMLMALLQQATGFGIISDVAILMDQNDILSQVFVGHSNWIASSIPSAIPLSNASPDFLAIYKQSLATNPLETKMITGALLATTGDAIAQSKEVDTEYDTKRASSFLVFDMAYRALQHLAFPVITDHCHGQYILGAISATPLVSLVSEQTNPAYFAAMEQCLASQLGIVPFIYYPVFYVLTAFVQGLNKDDAIQRARETFVPLMKRNLLFWIPVQFIQFGFVEENLQIPFLSICGLMWTIIISAMAGSAKKYAKEEEDQYCIIGIEDQCVIDNDQLFPDITAGKDDSEIIEKALKNTVVMALEEEPRKSKILAELDTVRN